MYFGDSSYSIIFLPAFHSNFLHDIHYFHLLVQDIINATGSEIKCLSWKMRHGIMKCGLIERNFIMSSLLLSFLVFLDFPTLWTTFLSYGFYRHEVYILGIEVRKVIVNEQRKLEHKIEIFP